MVSVPDQNARKSSCIVLFGAVILQNRVIVSYRTNTMFVAVSSGFDTCFAVKDCDGLCHLTKSMDRIETPLGFGGPFPGVPSH